jgi:hypothetical protein
MSIVADLLLSIIVISHLAAQWYLFRFIRYHALGWMRGPRRAERHKLVPSSRKVVGTGQWPAATENRAS